LKVGDKIDCVKGDFKCKAWGLATIVEIDDEETVKVEF